MKYKKIQVIQCWVQFLNTSSPTESWGSSPSPSPGGSSPSLSPVGSSPSPQNKYSSRTRVHCRTRVLHHWFLACIATTPNQLAIARGPPTTAENKGNSTQPPFRQCCNYWWCSVQMASFSGVTLSWARLLNSKHQGIFTVWMPSPSLS